MGSNPILSATWRIRQEVKPPGFQSGIGGFDSPMRHHLPGWWNWQTHRIQNPPPFGVWVQVPYPAPILGYSQAVRQGALTP